MSNPFNESDMRHADTGTVAQDPLAGARKEVYGAMQTNSQITEGSFDPHRVMADNSVPPVRIIPPVPRDGEDAWHGGPMGGKGLGAPPDPFERNHDDGWEVPFRQFK